jgi:hypothetical protein
MRRACRMEMANQTTSPSTDSEEDAVELSTEDMALCSGVIAEALNKLQTEHHFTVDQVLAATGFTLGYFIGETGAVLGTDEPLEEALPEVVEGYRAGWEEFRVNFLAPGDEKGN